MESGSLVASGALSAQGSCLRPLCRNFARGFCRWGQNCRFSHYRKSPHVCRYFQGGFCSFGERCSYEHIRVQPVPVGTRYGPVPTVPPVRWGLQPGCVPGAVPRGWGGAQHGSTHLVPSVTHVAFKFASMVVENKEKEKENIQAPDNVPHGAVGGAFVPIQDQDASGSQPQVPRPDPNPSDPREDMVETAPGTDPSKVPMEQGAAAAPVPNVVLRARSKAVVCGICMDRVYEKPQPEERLFGILPNCSHAYCLGCIRKWRRSRDFQSTVIKACPECRITSTYYIPHKYWVSDAGEKEKLIKTFKARMGKIRCKFFIRNRGRCPFKSDCIYLHELPGSRALQRQQQRPRGPVGINPSLSESSEEEEEVCVLQWALDLDESGFWCSRHGHDIFPDSD